jgi:pimeloyl-ACP methyl ester carboxylesterase
MVGPEGSAKGGWTYHRVDGASHFLRLDKPDHVNAIIVAALEDKET